MIDLIDLIARRAWKTTEFWSALILSVVAILNSLFDLNLDPVGLSTAAGAVAAFIIGRSWVKKTIVETIVTVEPVQEPTQNVAPPVGG